jgi:hypothetical protein
VSGPGLGPGSGLQASHPGLGLGPGEFEARASSSRARARASRPSRARDITNVELVGWFHAEKWPLPWCRNEIFRQASPSVGWNEKENTVQTRSSFPGNTRSQQQEKRITPADSLAARDRAALARFATRGQTKLVVDSRPASNPECREVGLVRWQSGSYSHHNPEIPR